MSEPLRHNTILLDDRYCGIRIKPDHKGDWETADPGPAVGTILHKTKDTALFTQTEVCRRVLEDEIRLYKEFGDVGSTDL